MKKYITLIALLFSVNTFASPNVYSEAAGASLCLPTLLLNLTYAITTGNWGKEAAQMIVNDSVELIQSGRMSAFLDQKIKDIQAQDASLSDEDALDILVSVSEQVLK